MRKRHAEWLVAAATVCTGGGARGDPYEDVAFSTEDDRVPGP